MFLDGEKGTSFDIVVAVVFDQVFDSLAGSGAFLDFIEDNDRMPLLQCDIIDELELSEKIRLFVGIPKFICENMYGIPQNYDMASHFREMTGIFFESKLSTSHLTQPFLTVREGFEPFPKPFSNRWNRA